MDLIIYMYLTKFHPTFKETVKYKRESEAKWPGKKWLPIETENSSNKKELKKKHTNIHTTIWNFQTLRIKMRYFLKFREEKAVKLQRDNNQISLKAVTYTIG